MKWHSGVKEHGAGAEGLSNAVVEDVINRAVMNGPDSLIFNHGVLQSHLAELVPPVCDLQTEWMSEDGTLGSTSNGDPLPSFRGEVFADGSCSKDLPRAQPRFVGPHQN